MILSVQQRLERDLMIMAAGPTCGATYPWTDLRCALDPDLHGPEHRDPDGITWRTS